MNKAHNINFTFGSVGVFPPTEPMHLISTLSYEQDTLQVKCGRVIDSSISISESSEPVNPKSKLKIKTSLAEEGGTTIRGATMRIFILEANQGTRSMNFIRT
jgi:hypothetical protein